MDNEAVRQQAMPYAAKAYYELHPECKTKLNNGLSKFDLLRPARAMKKIESLVCKECFNNMINAGVQASKSQ